jgi:hypothetical protein
VLEPLWQVEPTIALGSKDCSGLRRNRFLGGRDPFRISYQRAVARGTIEQAFNTIWRVKFPRKLARRFSAFLGVLLVGPVLVFAALTLTATLQSNSFDRNLLAARFMLGRAAESGSKRF